jgi:hypothetical protein
MLVAGARLVSLEFTTPFGCLATADQILKKLLMASFMYISVANLYNRRLQV